MSFSMMTTSFPIDSETYKEINELCNVAQVHDEVNYYNVLNMMFCTKSEATGFFVLVYDDQTDQLVAVASAIDMMGLHTYEWSLLVAPKYRQLGLGTALFTELQNAFSIRNIEGQLALCVEAPNVDFRRFIEKKGYMYSFSDITLACEAVQSSTPYMIRPYEEKDRTSLVLILMRSFGDLEEEAHDLIDFNTSSPDLTMWVMEVENKVVGTITTRVVDCAQWITAVAIDLEEQGKGYGTALLNWSKNKAFQEQLKRVKLEVEIDNVRALSVYEKAGFTKCTQIDYFARVV